MAIGCLDKINDMEGIQAGGKLHELETTLEVHYSYLETDHGQNQNKPQPSLQPQQVRSDTQTCAPGR